MNMGRFFVLAIMVLGVSPVGAFPITTVESFSLICSDAPEDRSAFSIVNDKPLSIQASSAEGQRQLEKYYERELGFRPSDNFSLSKVRLELPIADASCKHAGPYTYECDGHSENGVIEIFGFLSKNVTWGQVNLRRPVEVRNLTLNTWLQTDYSQVDIQHKIAIRARAEVVLDGESIILILAPEFDASAKSSDGTKCEGR